MRTPITIIGSDGHRVTVSMDRADVDMLLRDHLTPEELARIIIGGDHPLKVWRIKRGYSYRKLGAVVAMSHQGINDIEMRRADGSVETLLKLAKVLGCTVDDLLAESPTYQRT